MSLDKSQHLRAALQAAERALPLDVADFADPDLRCAAFFTAQFAETLEDDRSRLWQPAKALSEQLQPLSTWFRAKQAPIVKAVAGTLHVALTTIVTGLLLWPDWSLSLRYLLGFSQVGVLEFAGTLRDPRLDFYDAPRCRRQSL